jgi:hypothetical protein
VLYRLNSLLQVYGGAVAFVIGSKIWSANYFFGGAFTFLGGSIVSAGPTIVTGLSVTLFDVSVYSSSASTYTLGGTTSQSSHLFGWFRRQLQHSMCD